MLFSLSFLDAHCCYHRSETALALCLTSICILKFFFGFLSVRREIYIHAIMSLGRFQCDSGHRWLCTTPTTQRSVLYQLDSFHAKMQCVIDIYNLLPCLRAPGATVNFKLKARTHNLSSFNFSFLLYIFQTRQPDLGLKVQLRPTYMSASMTPWL